MYTLTNDRIKEIWQKGPPITKPIESKDLVQVLMQSFLSCMSNFYG